MNWSEKERKKKRIFFSLVGEWCLVLDQQQQQAISLYTTRIQNNTYSLYIYIYIQSTTKDKKDINKIKKE